MTFNPESKVWIYQSNRAFSDSELAYLHAKLNTFVENWTAHNQQLTAGFEIRYNRFIVLIVDETLAGASGCSIDKSVHLMKEIEQDLQVNLFDRLHLAWKNQDGTLLSLDRADFEREISNGLIDANTTVFNNLVKNYAEYQSKWEVPLKESWHAKVFNVQSLKV